MWAVPLAAAELHSRRDLLHAITAIGDCDPAAFCIARGASRTPIMNGLVQRLQEMSPDCLPVSVPRRLNFDADRLSHPHLLLDVLASLPRHLSLRIASVPHQAWEVLRALLARGC